MNSSNKSTTSWLPTILLGAAVAVSAIAITAFTKTFSATNKEHQSRTTRPSSSSPSSTKTKTNSLRLQEVDNNDNKNNESLVQARFQTCVELMGPQLKALPQKTQLQYYGLFKQGALGDVTDYQPDMPPAYDLVATAKYQAWKSRTGLSRVAAMQEYIDKVVQFEYVKSIGGGDDDDDDDNDLEGDAVMDVMGMGNKPSTLVHDYDNNNDADYAQEDAEFPLHAAAREGQLEKLQSLLSSAGADETNRVDSSGQTPLHLAADRGYTECMKALILAGANVHAVDSEGISVLQAAVISGSVECCRILLSLGCDPHQTDNDGDSPWDAAQDDPNIKILMEQHQRTPIVLEDSQFVNELKNNQRGIVIPSPAPRNNPKVNVDVRAEMKRLESPIAFDLDDDGDM
ncbi:ankyrin repeat domain protein [Nitzschia inconspicua]|uniref:Ankyrin repeat domain protein n=1 Tax=Nitzschia inconspicua TaxID=303405 RepID=A0A9K3PLR9_9STRA|nr:ankyrin repeat domain protein [Nitzschia inconspicua]